MRMCKWDARDMQRMYRKQFFVWDGENNTFLTENVVEQLIGK